MPADNDRQAAHDELKERFLSDPAFRATVMADPEAALQDALGPLTDEEREAVATLTATPRTEAELVEQLRSGGLGSW